ncbi:hypothetical protein, partial [Sphingomonas carotinifaciens]|uniref:hypothetical protein n=1 Tax=Sphingomonas carotinifaciens TaxID=1166323 RepID=UPI00196713A1
STIRTARARTSGENLFVVLLIQAPPSQELEPPTNPGRFTPVRADESDEPYQSGPFKESHLSEQEAINNGITE